MHIFFTKSEVLNKRTKLTGAPANLSANLSKLLGKKISH